MAAYGIDGGECMAHHLGQRVVLIGGSLAGLMTARVLADHFDAVTILERDSIDGHPALHRWSPQGNHLYTLLLGGQQVMGSLYPGFVARLASLGTVCCRAGMEIAFYLPSG
jgi:predicted NAD/FAD-binding protein